MDADKQHIVHEMRIDGIELRLHSWPKEGLDYSARNLAFSARDRRMDLQIDITPHEMRGLANMLNQMADDHETALSNAINAQEATA